MTKRATLRYTIDRAAYRPGQPPQSITAHQVFPFISTGARSALKEEQAHARPQQGVLPPGRRESRLPGPVFEFGSYQVEGQEGYANLRELFVGRTYVGCDMRPGPGVDRVEDVTAIGLPDGSAGTVLCIETFEHVFEVQKAFTEVFRLLQPGGVFVITTPLTSGFMAILTITGGSRPIASAECSRPTRPGSRATRVTTRSPIR